MEANLLEAAGLTYTAAIRAAESGLLIRRESWLNPLRLQNGSLEFVKAVQAYSRAYVRDYEPTLTDRNARDWCVA